MPRLPAEASAEAIAAYEKAQKAFVKDDSLAQLILVGNMDDSNAELTSVCTTKHIEPEAYKEAMASEDSDKWLAAMKEELESLSNNNTWILVNLPSDRKAIACVF
ncbi:hypothetical protein TNCT_712001 [Trichonephila clavata]|uniref:Uncharacterized protein n=1 Tax=Trichonephila clavata TaxID=2740835 RepID=A0A8X6L4G8_TRICU|nr:hypothetical protein TNCT_712001 [Trichonephila clavata]